MEKKFGHKKLYIGGELRNAHEKTNYEVICPADESAIATIAWAGKRDTEQALEAAAQGFKLWSNLPLENRLTWIGKLRSAIVARSEYLREAIMYEMGKTWEGTEEDLTSIADSLEFYSTEIRERKVQPIEDKEGTHSHHLLSQPLGVVVAFLAYNFPLLNLGFKLGPALAAGCSIIIKPSEFSPLSAYLIGEICAEIDFPPGVVNIICGSVADVGQPLCESEIPRLVTMIGSTATAQKLIAQSCQTSLKRYSMECGGNAPFIVFDDAHLEQALEHGVALKLGNAGQICVAPNRFYIQQAVLPAFVEGMVNRFEQAKIGFGRENQPDMGPLANKQSVEKIDGMVKDALDQGGRLLCGGKKLDRPGYYYAPTVIVFDDAQSRILQEEIFGPVAFIVPFSDVEQVIQWANHTDAGLASYVYSGNEDTLSFFADKLEFGEVQLNGLKYDIYLPHGGIKNSGIGVDCSSFALDDYLIKKRVTKALV